MAYDEYPKNDAALDNYFNSSSWLSFGKSSPVKTTDIPMAYLPAKKNNGLSFEDWFADNQLVNYSSFTPTSLSNYSGSVDNGNKSIFGSKDFWFGTEKAPGALKLGLGALDTAFNAFNTYQSNKLKKEQLALSKEYAKKNYDAQVKAYNTQIYNMYSRVGKPVPKGAYIGEFNPEGK